MLIAWHGEPKLKAAALERLREHRRLDEIVQGQYWRNGKGCQLGCLTHTNFEEHKFGPHYAAEKMFGLAQATSYWLESVFERLSSVYCAAWVIESCEAIPVGADMSPCDEHLIRWLVDDSEMRGQIAPAGLRDRLIASSSASQCLSTIFSNYKLIAVGRTYIRAIAAKSLEIFRAAPIVTTVPQLPETSRIALCAAGIWCDEPVAASPVAVLPVGA